MMMTKPEKIVLVGCIIDFNNIQVWLRQFSLSLNACQVMEVFFNIWLAGIEIQAIPSYWNLYIVEISDAAY